MRGYTQESHDKLVNKLKRANSEDATDEELEVYKDYQHKIEKTSGNWYEGKAVSPGFQRKMDALTEVNNERQKLMKEQIDRRRELYLDNLKKQVGETNYDEARRDIAKKYNKSKYWREHVKASDKSLDSSDDEFKNQYVEINKKQNDRKNALIETVLKDMHWPDTPEMREQVYPLIFWD